MKPQLIPELNIELLNPPEINKISHPLLIEKSISLSILRIDQTDAVISGNKWFKLKYNLIEARHQGCQILLSFGGPYSNHIHALAAAGKAYQFNTVGIIRGEEHLPLNPTLSDAVKNGMKLYYIDRKTYRNKQTIELIEQLKAMLIKDDPFFLKSKAMQSNASDIYIVPEGGTNELAIKGAAEIVSFIPHETDYITIPCGTGGTMAGIISGIRQSEAHHADILGFPALKGVEYLQKTISSILLPTCKNPQTRQARNWKLFFAYHFGGFGKINKQLALFIQEFEQSYGIELDPIYTAKMFYAVMDMIKSDYFPEGSKIIAIHTGGLQGKRGMEEKIEKLISGNKHNRLNY